MNWDEGGMSKIFSIEHQLLINSGVLMKNRKSTLSYTYRIVLMETRIQEAISKCEKTSQK